MKKKTLKITTRKKERKTEIRHVLSAY
jgi:hypothetical protein